MSYRCVLESINPQFVFINRNIEYSRLAGRSSTIANLFSVQRVRAFGLTIAIEKKDRPKRILYDSGGRAVAEFSHCSMTILSITYAMPVH